MTARQRFRSAHHTGAFWAQVENDRVVGVAPFEEDAAPDLDAVAAWPEAAHAPHRVARPSVRRGWLKRAEKNGRITPQGLRGEDGHTAIVKELLRLTERRMEGPYELATHADTLRCTGARASSP